MAAPKLDPSRILNVNVGILGHIDSGKTSLARSLSTHLSTASLDKHPQSAERGITLDLGFSAFTVPLPAHLGTLPYDELQFTLVDCPGHASLIKTIIGGAQIIDVMMLVIDVTKGIQTQTAECLVVGEILTQELVVVLNKIDLLEEGEREEKIEKMRKKLAKTFESTKFAGCTMLAVSARPGGGEGDAPPMNLQVLVDQISLRVGESVHTRRQSKDPFLFSVDHCFAIRGQGTVMTGTVLQGGVSVKDTVEVPDLRLQLKVKSMQMFKRPVQALKRGDRAGICVTNLDAKAMERGIVSAPGTVPTIHGAIAAVEKVRFYKSAIETKSKFHITVGHTTVMATLMFFSKPAPPGWGGRGGAGEGAAGGGGGGGGGGEVEGVLEQLSIAEASQGFSFEDEYQYRPQLLSPAGHGVADPGGDAEDEGPAFGTQWCLLTFEQPINCPRDSLILGSRLEADIHLNTCRIGFHGKLAHTLDPGRPEDLERLKIFKTKSREGTIDRYVDGHTAICKGLFKKETDLSLFNGMKVTTARGEVGTISGAFGKSGKVKIQFPGGVEPPGEGGSGTVTLAFKRYVFDKDKKVMVQS